MVNRRSCGSSRENVETLCEVTGTPCTERQGLGTTHFKLWNKTCPKERRSRSRTGRWKRRHVGPCITGQMDKEGYKSLEIGALTCFNQYMTQFHTQSNLHKWGQKTIHSATFAMRGAPWHMSFQGVRKRSPKGGINGITIRFKEHWQTYWSERD